MLLVFPTPKVISDKYNNSFKALKFCEKCSIYAVNTENNITKLHIFKVTEAPSPADDTKLSAGENFFRFEFLLKMKLTPIKR